MGSLTAKPVIIIGAGIGGLALAQGLRRSAISFKIYERSHPDDVRAQGYRIRLHGDGLGALRSVLDDELWNLFSETCAETKLSALPYIDATVDRAILREVLLTGMDDHIHFGKIYSHYELTDSGIIARFVDGTFEAGSLIVGADGARSAVRRQYLPQFRVLDTRNSPIYGMTPLTPSFCRRILPKATECLSLVRDPKAGGLTLMEVMRFLPKSQRSDKRTLPNDYVYWTIMTPLATRRTPANGQTAAELAKISTAHWHPSLLPLIEDQDPSRTGTFRLLTADPESLTTGWEANARITIIGDAAHAMMPSTASGAVSALKDAGMLASLIKEHGIVLESIAKYEMEMRKYASEAVTTSARIGETVFGLGALADAEVVSS